VFNVIVYFKGLASAAVVSKYILLFMLSAAHMAINLWQPCWSWTNYS